MGPGGRPLTHVPSAEGDHQPLTRARCRKQIVRITNRVAQNLGRSWTWQLADWPVLRAGGCRRWSPVDAIGRGREPRSRHSCPMRDSGASNRSGSQMAAFPFAGRQIAIAPAPRPLSEIYRCPLCIPGPFARLAADRSATGLPRGRGRSGRAGEVAEPDGEAVAGAAERDVEAELVDDPQPHAKAPV